MNETSKMIVNEKVVKQSARLKTLAHEAFDNWYRFKRASDLTSYDNFEDAAIMMNASNEFYELAIKILVEA